MKTKSFRFWNRVALLLPRELIHASFINVVVFATSGKYENTVISTIPAIEALGRWVKGGEK